MDTILTDKNIIAALKKLEPGATNEEFAAISRMVEEVYPQQRDFENRAQFNKVITDVRDHGYHGDAALARRDLISYDELSDQGLDNLEEKTREWNKEIGFLGAGSLSPDTAGTQEGDDERNAAAASGVIDTADDLAGKAKSKFQDVTKALKAGGKVLNAAGVAIDLDEVWRGMSIASKIKAERKRRENEAKGIKPEAPPKPQSEIDENDTNEGLGPGAERTSPDQKNNVSKAPQDDGQQKAETDLSDIISYDNLNDDAKQVFNKIAPDNGFEESVRAISLKDPADMTEGEAKALIQVYQDPAIDRSDQQNLVAKVQAFYDTNYGTDPVPTDDTGRTHALEPVRTVPEKSQPAKTAKGGLLADGLQQVAGLVASAAHKDGRGPAVKALQTGFNLVGSDLKVDGDAGEKTLDQTVKTIAQHGPGRVREAQAVGALHQYAGSVRDEPAKVADLASTIERTIKPLFGDTKRAAQVVQAGINDLNKDNAAETQHLAEDGDIGEKTRSGFTIALADHGPDELVKSIGRTFGFV